MDIKKLIRGSGNRKTRFHTENGIRLSLLQILQDAPPSLGLKIKSLYTNWRPLVPCWHRRVMDAVDAFIDQNNTAIEFGAGGSTLWLAQRARSVYSTEANVRLFMAINALMEHHGIENICLSHHPEYNFWDPDDRFGEFSVAVIDGAYRWRGLERIFARMREKGLIYLHNADSDQGHRTSQDAPYEREARQLLLDYHQKNSQSRLVKVRGLPYGKLTATEGWLLYL